MPAAVVPHRRPDVRRNAVQVSQQVLDGPAVQARMVLQCGVQPLDIDAMVLVVVNAHRARIEMRLECIRRKGQRRKLERIGLGCHAWILLWVPATQSRGVVWLSSEDGADLVRHAVVDQRHHPWPRSQFGAVELQRDESPVDAAWILERDLVAGSAVAKADLESRPGSAARTDRAAASRRACGSRESIPGRRDTSSRPSPCTRSSRRARRAAARSRRRPPRRRVRPCSAMRRRACSA